MKLYYKPGACSMASHIVLNELGDDYRLEKVDTASGRTESGADYAAINPRGYVPALALESGEIITENAAILQYLADRRPAARLAPSAGGLSRIRLQEALSFLSSELHKAFGPFFSGAASAGESRIAALARLSRQIGHVEAMLRDGRAHLLGSEFTVADAYAFTLLNWARFIEVSLQEWPATAAYVARLSTRPSIARALREEGLAA